MYVSYCGIFVKGMVLRYHWCMIFPIEVRKHKCCHKVALASNLHAPCNSHHHKLGFFWTWCQLMIIWSIKRDSTTKDFEDSVGVCKVVALSLLVKQSGFLAPLPPLTAPTLFVALLTGSSLAAECENLGCAIIIGGADQESKRLPTWGVVVGGNDSDEIIVVASSQLGPARNQRGSRKLATL